MPDCWTTMSFSSVTARSRENSMSQAIHWASFGKIRKPTKKEEKEAEKVAAAERKAVAERKAGGAEGERK